MKRLFTKILIVASVGLIFGSMLTTNTSCRKDDEEPVLDTNKIGTVTINLSALKADVRTKETEVGNLVTDALMKYAKDSLNIQPDFALMNGGGIRHDATTRPDGIYAAGIWNNAMVKELLPFVDNNIQLIQLTGAQLKSVFERSAYALPGQFGGFFQVSKEIKITIDATKQQQVLSTDNPPVIQTEGERITSIKINGTEYSASATYKFIVSDYQGNGGDGFVTLRDLPAAQKQTYNSGFQSALRTYIFKNSPVTPVVEGRITITGVK